MTLNYFYFDKTKEYARLLKKQYEIEKELNKINDEIINLKIVLTDEEIKEAIQLLKEKDDEIW